MEEIDNIEEHETKNADITFKHRGKYYAIEIETGNLLKKQKQLTEKIAYLNQKYKNRWFFLVSHRNLQTKYKKCGINTQRTNFEKTIKKLLKTDTQ